MLTSSNSRIRIIPFHTMTSSTDRRPRKELTRSNVGVYFYNFKAHNQVSLNVLMTVIPGKMWTYVPCACMLNTPK